MPTLNNFSVSTDVLRQTFTQIIATFSSNIPSDLPKIFEIGLRDRSLFPNINLGANVSYEYYLEKWITFYLNAWNNPPSARIAKPKDSCSDPALKTIVQIVREIDESEAARREKDHNLFMSAENAQGSLLEEYIYRNIKACGWLWCCGNVFRAVDFCASDGSYLLQIKNKCNSENSSSSAIRVGTDIKKWYRLKKKTVRGLPYPIFCWDELNFIVNKYSTNPNLSCVMSEEDYIDFLKNVVGNNKNIVSDL